MKGNGNNYALSSFSDIYCIKISSPCILFKRKNCHKNPHFKTFKHDNYEENMWSVLVLRKYILKY